MIRSTAVFSVLFLIAAAVEGAEKDVEVLKSWAGKVADGKLEKNATMQGIVTERKEWEKLWKETSGDKAPEVDFKKEVILFAKVHGPNKLAMRPVVSDKGDVTLKGGATKVGGSGFSYLIVKIEKKGVKSFNGKVLK